KATIAACVRVPGASGKRLQSVQTFGTTTSDLLALRDWLDAHRVTHVAMESTSCSQREPKSVKGDDVRSVNLRGVVCGALAPVLIRKGLARSPLRRGSAYNGAQTGSGRGSPRRA